MKQSHMESKPTLKGPCPPLPLHRSHHASQSKPWSSAALSGNLDRKKALNSSESTVLRLAVEKKIEKKEKRENERVSFCLFHRPKARKMGGNWSTPPPPHYRDPMAAHRLFRGVDSRQTDLP